MKLTKKISGKNPSKSFEKLVLLSLEFSSQIPLADRALKSLQRFSKRLEDLSDKDLEMLQNIEVENSDNINPEIFSILYHKRKITKTNICNLHKYIFSTPPKNVPLGKIRRKQNWVGPIGKGRDFAYFFPPEPKDVSCMLENLLNWIYQTKMHPLITISVFFAQILIIHPFMDGNGKLARLLIPLYLRSRKIIPKSCFFMSHYFKQNRKQYFNKLYRITTRNDWKRWIVFFLKGIISETKALELKLKP